MKKLLQLDNIKRYFYKPETITLLLSILITGLVSAIIGCGGYIMTGNFWGFFFVSFGLQFVLFAIINTLLQRKDTIDATKIVNEQLDILSRFTVRLTCAYCKQKNEVPVNLNQENRYQCSSCNQVNSIKMQFFSTQITTPLNKVILPAGEESIEFKTTLS
jgi:hypothetical protein